MIISLSGRAGSGKDTVGKIMQYLQCHNTGGITIEDVIYNTEHEWWLEEQSRWEIKKFAGKMKTVASLLTGIPVEKFEDQNFKMTNLGQEWARPFYDSKGNVHYEVITVRKFLQLLGTEAMREGLHTNVWVNALFADYVRPSHWENRYYDEVNKKGLAGREEVWGDYPNWIITDMRFLNEIEAVKQRGGITIRVVRPDMHSLQAMVPAHISETALDDAEFDYEIINDAGVPELIEKVREILTKEKIIDGVYRN